MPTVIAEIGDKMPTVGGTLALSLAFALALALMIRRRWWLVFLSVPTLALWNWTMIAELAEPAFGKLILSELGRGYAVGRFAAVNGPFAAVVMLAWRGRSKQVWRARRQLGRCLRCGYDRRTLGTDLLCPECGERPAFTAGDTPCRTC